MAQKHPKHATIDTSEDSPGHAMAGTPSDQADMQRMALRQQFTRNFSFIPIFGFSAVLVSGAAALRLS